MWPSPGDVRRAAASECPALSSFCGAQPRGLGHGDDLTGTRGGQLVVADPGWLQPLRETGAETKGPAATERHRACPAFQARGPVSLAESLRNPDPSFRNAVLCVINCFYLAENHFRPLSP